MSEKILVGIVTYNPEKKRLKENITAVLEQADNILIVDNGSENYNEFINELPESVKYINNDKNEGIAKALSQLMLYAKENGFDWVLSLDQDSVLQPGTLQKYVYYAEKDELQDAAMFTCLIKDRNFSDKKNEEQERDFVEVPYCITSAAFTSVDKYFRTSGYDTDFFIDAVDFDICYSLREAGFRIVRINHTGLYHEVGHGENRRFLWKSIVVYHQKPFRIYYMARNTLLMSKKHKKLFPFYAAVKKETALLLRILLYEDEKIKKLRQFIKGIFDA